MTASQIASDGSRGVREYLVPVVETCEMMAGAE